LPIYDSIGRLKSQQHWQTDVVAGWLLGSVTGYWSTTRQLPISVQILPRGLLIGFSKRLMFDHASCTPAKKARRRGRPRRASNDSKYFYDERSVHDYVWSDGMIAERVNPSVACSQRQYALDHSRSKILQAYEYQRERRIPR
jgi:hypothetical protein